MTSRKKSSKPARGTRDILPKQAELRAKTIEKLASVFRKYGFLRIETPAIESIQNLSSGEGGENESLVFQIMKRGDKLKRELDNNSGNYCDLGLRYDLTVPLSRFVANSSSEIPTVFRSLQFGPVWRAERPQKGRFREFFQCDADIIGESSNLAEIELINATSEALEGLGLCGFKVRINDRRLLNAMVLDSGFEPNDVGSILITLDKIDKVEVSGVRNELVAKGFNDKDIDKLLSPLVDLKNSTPQDFGSNLSSSVVEELNSTLECVASFAKNRNFEIVFDPTLVRGMGYYTGQIFEIQFEDYPFSIAGGGRYDNMIRSFGGQSGAACGFSIGFERIITILEDKNLALKCNDEKLLVVYEKNCTKKFITTIANKLRADGRSVYVARKSKNLNSQISQFHQLGFENFVSVSNDQLSDEVSCKIFLS